MVSLAESTPSTQSWSVEFGIFSSISESITGRIGAVWQVAGPLGVIARVGMVVGVGVAADVGKAVEVGARVRVGLLLVARGIMVGMVGPNSVWQPASNKVEANKNPNPHFVHNGFISLIFPIGCSRLFEWIL